MRLAALFMLLVAGLHAQNIAIVQVGQLQCAAMIRTFNTVHTWCYAPGQVLVSNHLVTVYNSTVDNYPWCAGGVPTVDLPAPAPTGCTYSSVGWTFSINPTGPGINFAVAGTGIVGTNGEIKGTLTLLPTTPPPAPGKVALQGNLTVGDFGEPVATAPWSGQAVTSTGTWPAYIGSLKMDCKTSALSGGDTIQWFELPAKAPTTNGYRSASLKTVVNANIYYRMPVCAGVIQVVY